MWWLSNVHSALLKGQDESWRVAWRNISDVWEPHDLVRHVHASLAANPRFRRSNGAELAFFATHPVLTSFTGSNIDTNSGVHAVRPVLSPCCITCTLSLPLVFLLSLF